MAERKELKLIKTLWGIDDPISPSLLTKRLNQLQDSGLVVKKTLPEQRRAEYYLTLAGRELEPIVVALGEWGMRWARGQMTDDELDVEFLMWDLQRRVQTEHLPDASDMSVKELTCLPIWAFLRWLRIDKPNKSAHPTRYRHPVRIHHDFNP